MFESVFNKGVFEHPLVLLRQHQRRQQLLDVLHQQADAAGHQFGGDLRAQKAVQGQVDSIGEQPDLMGLVLAFLGKDLRLFDVLNKFNLSRYIE